jgi:hypothetical protein
LIGDGLQSRFQPPPVDTSYLPTPGYDTPSEQIYEQQKKSARPVSWHPSSHQIVHQQSYMQQNPMLYPFSTYNDAAFSPLSLPYSNMDSQQFFTPSGHVQQIQQVPVMQETCHQNHDSRSITSEVSCQPASRIGGGALDWKSFAVQDGFNRCSAPPTPEDLYQPRQLETKLATEDSIPYQPLEDDDSDGEILYGMGLYDAPEKPAEDSVLDLHRSTIRSLLGGGGAYPEPTGKGLKLEDAWEPPASDDEDGSNEDEDDAEGEEQD